jgi:hypothetical protein
LNNILPQQNGWKHKETNLINNWGSSKEQGERTKLKLITGLRDAQWNWASQEKSDWRTGANEEEIRRDHSDAEANNQGRYWYQNRRVEAAYNWTKVQN